MRHSFSLTRSGSVTNPSRLRETGTVVLET